MGVPAAVFVETNLGTRLAVPTSPDITADHFKREVERMHLNCFPGLGNIRVNTLMVKEKLHCYHLSGSLPLKYAFLGSNASWFLQTRVNLSNTPHRVESLKYNEADVCNLNSSTNAIADSVETGGFLMPSKCRRKKVKVQRFPNFKASMLKLFPASCFSRKRRRKNVRIGKPRRGPVQHTLTEKETLSQSAPGAEVSGSKKTESNADAEAIAETISEPASVSGLIKKYFSDYEEVASTPAFVPTREHYGRRNRISGSDYLNVQSRDAWPEKPLSKHKKPEVGKRLLLASDSLGLAPSHQRSVLSLCRDLVFDMMDEGGGRSVK